MITFLLGPFLLVLFLYSPVVPRNASPHSAAWAPASQVLCSPDSPGASPPGALQPAPLGRPCSCLLDPGPLSWVTPSSPWSTSSNSFLRKRNTAGRYLKSCWVKVLFFSYCPTSWIICQSIEFNSRLKLRISKTLSHWLPFLFRITILYVSRFVFFAFSLWCSVGSSFYHEYSKAVQSRLWSRGVGVIHCVGILWSLLIQKFTVLGNILIATIIL